MTDNANHNHKKKSILITESFIVPIPTSDAEVLYPFNERITLLFQQENSINENTRKSY